MSEKIVIENSSENFEEAESVAQELVDRFKDSSGHTFNFQQFESAVDEAAENAGISKQSILKFINIERGGLDSSEGHRVIGVSMQDS